MWIVLIVIGTSIWVYFDAKSIGVKKSGDKAPVKTGSVQADMGPLGWAICCLLLWIIVFPIYLFKRPGLKRRFQQPASAPAPPIPAPVAAGSQPQDFDQQLRTLAKLRAEGVITDEDFTRKKRQILGL